MRTEGLPRTGLRETELERYLQFYDLAAVQEVSYLSSNAELDNIEVVVHFGKSKTEKCEPEMWDPLRNYKLG